MNNSKLRTCAVLISAIGLTPFEPACGGSPLEDSMTKPAEQALLAAVLPQVAKTGRLVGGGGKWPGGIGGVHFRSGSQQGVTDSSGAFTYEPGVPVTFTIADIQLRPVAGAPLLSAWQLVADGKCLPSEELQKLLVLLESLDADGDPRTAMQLAAHAPGPALRELATLGEEDLAAVVQSIIPGRALVSAAEAQRRFVTQLDSETWTQIGMDTFDPLTAAQRSQGTTSDGSHWYFSWRFGLQRTDLDYNTQVNNPLAIPILLGLGGSDHIGDIDYWDSTLYVPIEDSKHYKAPKIVRYDLNLTAGKVFSLPNTMLTAGVPWVAVDGPRSQIYVAEWNPTPSILVFALSDVHFVKAIPLSTTLGRIQGAKVFDGALYASADDDNKTVYKIDLDTGTVLELFALHGSFEMEGLGFLARPDGSLMHTLNVAPSGLAMEFRHHQRTVAPLRNQVCR